MYYCLNIMYNIGNIQGVEQWCKNFQGSPRCKKFVV